MLFMLTSTHDGAFGILTFFVWFEAAFLSVPFPHLVSIINGKSHSDGFVRWQRQSDSDVFKSFLCF